MIQTWESADKTVKKEVTQTGEFSRKPTERSTCDIRIANIIVSVGSVEDLKKNFNTEILDAETEKTVVIGDANSEIDRQVERAIQMMMISEVSLVTVSVTSEILNESVSIKFEATLNKFEPYKPIWEWTPEEKYQIALKYKESGVELFKQSRCVDAFKKFSKACKILITLEPIPDLELDRTLERNINNLRLVLYNNMAGCHLNRKNFEHTVALCDKILNKEENNVKALYRRGVAHGNLKDLEKAVADLKNVITLEPHNRAAKEQFLIYNAKLQEANQKFEDMVRRMFKT